MAESPSAVPVDGQPLDGRLVAADVQWQLTFDVDGKQRTLPAAELVRWGSFTEPPRGPILLLADGGLLVADVLRADKERLAADSLLLGRIDFPLGSLAGVVFQLPVGRRQRDALLDRVARATGDSDRILLHNGDEITGLIARLANDTVELDTKVGPIEIETARIAAMIFNPELKQTARPKGLRAWTGLSDGSRLLATRLTADAKALRITTAGQTWATSPEELTALQPLGGRVIYLSDLRPAAYHHVPYLDLKWPNPGIDRNITGGRLWCDGRLYLKGLGLHSAARLTYALDGTYNRFDTELGIDDSTEGRGSVRFRIFVDGKQKYTSKTLPGGEPPVHATVDLTEAKRLDLIVDFADRADELDRADWLDARLVK
ncbi:MAG TPA: NPCBM/NEW2 domain-containing protein [Thermoguttaceae bacterium]|nr:NPCBM/NEW2 domain-containing protein [Thermoguttaceae bacterium]